MKISLLCGGPSLEKGISLNSARSVLDHLQDEKIKIVPIYFDYQKNAYLISGDQLYSNTPSDFDFKLAASAKSLNEKELVAQLKKSDIVFPLMHGSFGEDGQIQSFLEKNNIPFVGSGSNSCKKFFDKYQANQFIKNLGFFSLPSAVLKIYQNDHKEIINTFFRQNKIKRAAVKPAAGGSSIGVFSVNNAKEALEKAALIFSKRMDTRVVIEQFATGTEFTVIVLQNRFGLPVAILPTEIETNYEENQIFDFRKKYLPTRQVTFHCPPRIDDGVIEQIQLQAEQLFSAFKMRDFTRMDGWILPSGKIWFSDFNTISGMEQNSFLFQQASRVGLSHRGLIRYILKNACRRYGIKFPAISNKQNTKRKPVNILFGGKTSERQVSLMSGTNVWLKLLQSKLYEPIPHLLDLDGKIWKIPYALNLNHTVEEISTNCQHAKVDQERLARLVDKAKMKLSFEFDDKIEPFYLPKSMNLDEFIKNSLYVFIALHGGIGEDGTLQKLLEKNSILYNGPKSHASKLCANKLLTGKIIDDLKIRGIKSAPKKLIKIIDISRKEHSLKLFWDSTINSLGAKSLIVKPNNDGCSSGIAHLYSPDNLIKYLDALQFDLAFIPAGTFKNQRENIEMPLEKPNEILFEKFISTDAIHVKNNKLIHSKNSGWVELTIGLIEKNGKLHALNPSITVAQGEILTVEEKFQGGTGINITPPPAEIIKPGHLKRVKKLIEKLGVEFGIKGYSRVDAFCNTKNGDLIIIEINTLPGLTPSTVIFHQALAEQTKVFPRQFLEQIIQSSKY